MPFQMKPDHPDYVESATVDRAIAQAVVRHVGTDQVLSYVDFDVETKRITITSPDGSTTETPAIGAPEGSMLDPDSPATYDPETGILTLTFADGSSVTTADLRGKSAYQLAVDAGFDGTEAEWRASLGGGVSSDTSDLPGFTAATRIVVGTQAAYDERTPPADDETILYNIVGDA